MNRLLKEYAEQYPRGCNVIHKCPHLGTQRKGKVISDPNMSANGGVMIQITGVAGLVHVCNLTKIEGDENG